VQWPTPFEAMRGDVLLGQTAKKTTSSSTNNVSLDTVKNNQLALAHAHHTLDVSGRLLSIVNHEADCVTLSTRTGP
jgi:hypothetical protein